MAHFHMVWLEQALPQAQLPAGYSLRSFRPGDEAGWLACCEGGGLGTESWQDGDFRKKMLEMAGLCAEGIYFAVDEHGGIAGTTSAVRKEDHGYIHMVAVSKAHQGKALGKPINLIAMRDLTEAGYKKILLETDDWRVPAIKIYLWLGFLPIVDSMETLEGLKTAMRALGLTSLRTVKKSGEPDGEIAL